MKEGKEMKLLPMGSLLVILALAPGCASSGHSSWLALGKGKQTTVQTAPLPTQYEVPASVPHSAAGESLDPAALKAQRAAAKSLRSSGRSGGGGASCH